MRYWLAVVMLVAAILWMSFAHASPPDKADPSLAPWFNSLHSATGMSCCATYDGHIVDDRDIRETDAGYQVRIDGEWTVIEPTALLDRVDNPTGGWVVFWSPGEAPHRVFCAVRPAET